VRTGHVTAALLVAIAALAGAAAAASKDGVRATLTTSIPLDARPGSQLDVGWTLASTDDDGRRQPFGAGGVFVRLLSASGAKAETGPAHEGATGAYTASVEVPAGGIGDVLVGIHAWTTYGPSDSSFPITNDPLPGARHIGAPASADESGPSRTRLAVLTTGLFGALLVAAVARRLFDRVRRRQGDAAAQRRVIGVQRHGHEELGEGAGRLDPEL
jgi:hypothetical protein